MSYIGKWFFVDVPQHTHKDQQQQPTSSTQQKEKPAHQEWKKVDHKQFRNKSWGWWRSAGYKRSPSVHTGWANKMIALLGASIQQDDSRFSYLSDMLLSCCTVSSNKFSFYSYW